MKGSRLGVCGSVLLSPESGLRSTKLPTPGTQPFFELSPPFQVCIILSPGFCKFVK